MLESIFETRAPFRVGKVSAPAKHSICKRASQHSGISLQTAEKAFSELLIFLSACVNFKDASFRPSKTLDVVWHEFIIHTRDYIAFCESLGVNYIHHIPDSVPAQKMKGRDVREFLSEYGVPYDMSFWDDFSGECGCDKAIDRKELIGDVKDYQPDISPAEAMPWERG